MELKGTSLGRSLEALVGIMCLAAACLAFGAAPARAGAFVDCSNTADDDFDGLIDSADPDCASPGDDTENLMTPQLAHAAAGRLLDIYYPSVRRRVSCRKVAVHYRCRYSLRTRRNFVYKGLITAFDRELGGGRQDRFARLKSIRGSCGRIGRSGPFAIKTNNVSCVRARRDISAFYFRDQPLPYNCLVRQVPATARCTFRKRKLSFKFRFR